MEQTSAYAQLDLPFHLIQANSSEFNPPAIHEDKIFDAIIIGSSFAIDIVFLQGVSGEEGQKAAYVLVILLLWRIARVVDGIVITVKQRQEFRIRLQKRARRMAEKKLESSEEERHARTRQIEALKDLCSKAGINDADIAACAPKHFLRGNTTLCALSSVARLSVSMTMLMSSGVYRPRVGEDGLVILKPPIKPTEALPLASSSQNPPLFESLPNIASYDLADGRTKSHSRKSASGGKRKSKNHPANRTLYESVDETSYSAVDFKNSSAGQGDTVAHGAPVASKSAPGATGTTRPAGVDIQRLSWASNGAAGSTSPINSSGVQIVIDNIADEPQQSDATTPVANKSFDAVKSDPSGRVSKVSCCDDVAVNVAKLPNDLQSGASRASEVIPSASSGSSSDAGGLLDDPFGPCADSRSNSVTDLLTSPM